MQSAFSHGIKSRSWLCKPMLLPKASSCLADVGVPVLHRRAYSLDPLSFGPGRPILGSFSQQHWTSPSSALTHRNLSAVAIQVGRLLWLFLVFMLKKIKLAKQLRVLYYNTNVQSIDFSQSMTQHLKEACTLIFIYFIITSILFTNSVQGQRCLCQYDFLDLGEFEDNVRRAQSCKKMRHFIVNPDLAKLITQHLLPENATTIIFECNPGMRLVSFSENVLCDVIVLQLYRILLCIFSPVNKN